MMLELSSKHTIKDKLAVSLRYKDIAPKYEKSPVKDPFEDEEEEDIIVPVTVIDTHPETF
jgi:hypothetical protein